MFLDDGEESRGINEFKGTLRDCWLSGCYGKQKTYPGDSSSWRGERVNPLLKVAWRNNETLDIAKRKGKKVAGRGGSKVKRAHKLCL